MANQKKSIVELTPVLIAGSIAGFQFAPTSVIYFDDFAEEREGSVYPVPIKARGDAKLGKPMFGENGEPVGELLKDADGNQLYLLKDGKVSANIKTDGKLDENVRTETKQATSHTDFAKTVSTAAIVWPDGMVRDLKFRIKANAPATPEEWRARKGASAEKRMETMVKTAATETLEQQVARLNAEIERRKGNVKPAQDVAAKA